MLRLIAYFIAIGVLAFGLSWLADNPGRIVVNWQGTEWDTDVFQVTILLSVLAMVLIIAWTVLRGIWQSPAAIGNFFNRRRERRGLEALSSGMIAIGAGDRALATRYAVQARKSLPNEPMTHLLRAQAAQLAGDRGTSRRIFEAMLASPDTEALGLRGLFLEAEREGEREAARQFAARAVKLNPKLSWPVDALFDIQCREGDWAGALDTLAIARKHGNIDKTVADRRRAVLLTAQAQKLEDNDPERAMNIALEAHRLAVDLVPAAAIAGRILAARGSTPRATSILQKTWRKSPHPDLAVAYAYARLGDSPRDRLERVRQLAALTPNVSESPIAVANAAIEAKDYTAARQALEPLLEGRLSQRVCTLMARIASEETGNAGAVREWLARAVNAPRDPAWTADGVVSEHWQPVSPVTGALDAFQWRVPIEAAEPGDKELLARKIEELVALGARPESMINPPTTAVDVTAAPVASPAAPPSAPAMQPAAASAPAPRNETVDAEVVEVRRKPGAEEPAKAAAAAPAPAAAATAASVSANPAPPPMPEATRTPGTSASASQAAPSAANAAPGSAPAQPEPAQSVAASPASSSPPKAAAPGASTPPASVGASAAAATTVASASSAKQETTEAATPSATKPAAELKPAATTKPPSEPRIFVPPRAPDDPGPDDSEDSPRNIRSRAI